MKLILTIAGNALALWATAYFVPGITFTGDWIQLLIAGVLFGLLNLIVRPIAVLLSLPALVLTLGLFYFVLNGLQCGASRSSCPATTWPACGRASWAAS